MVNLFGSFIFLFCLLSFSLNADVSVTSQIEKAYENQPLRGTVTITHVKGQKVEKDTFLLGKNKIVTELVREVDMDPLKLSIYSFTLPGQPQGLYALPEISVKVDGISYQSNMSSYTVGPAPQEISPPSAQPIPVQPSVKPPEVVPQEAPIVKAPTKPLLRLEATVEGNSSLYPGQHTKLVYRYYFSGDITLTTEKLPLLDAEGFVKIGEKEIKDSSQGNVSIREISQEVEAIKPGKYTFGPSLIQGQGEVGSETDKLSSEVPPVELIVMTFPEVNKPASFNGAVGKFSFKTALISGPEMNLGDEISLALEVEGQGNLKNITAPDLCCQPGFSGFFRFSDLPPSENIENKTKKIVVKLRPLTTLVKAIPSIQFSYFDPESAQYVILTSEALPLSLKPLSNVFPETKKESNEEIAQAKIPNTPMKPSPIEIEGIYPLTFSDLYNKLLGNWWALILLPLGLSLLIYQYFVNNYLTWQQSQRPFFTSQKLFEQAFLHKTPDFNQLKKAFKLALFESGQTASVDISEEKLPDEGLRGEVKAFWLLLDRQRFAGKETYDVKEVYRLAKELMNKVQVKIKGKEEK